MNPPQKIALFGNVAPLGPPKMAPCGPLRAPQASRAPWGVVILATRMIILTTRMIILMLYDRPDFLVSKIVGEELGGKTFTLTSGLEFCAGSQ